MWWEKGRLVPGSEGRRGGGSLKGLGGTQGKFLVMICNSKKIALSGTGRVAMGACYDL